MLSKYTIGGIILGLYSAFVAVWVVVTIRNKRIAERITYKIPNRIPNKNMPVTVYGPKVIRYVDEIADRFRFIGALVDTVFAEFVEAWLIKQKLPSDKLYKLLDKCKIMVVDEIVTKNGDGSTIPVSGTYDPKYNIIYIAPLVNGEILDEVKVTMIVFAELVKAVLAVYKSSSDSKYFSDLYYDRVGLTIDVVKALVRLEDKHVTKNKIKHDSR